MSVWQKSRQMLEMIRFSHTIFALPFALLSAVMAWHIPNRSGETVLFRWQDLAGILVCMVAARSAAMAFNRLADRRIDAANPRTSSRHIPAGVLSTGSVAAFTIICCAIFVAGTLLFLPNRLPLYCSVPVLGVLMFYSYTKRFTAFAHYWLGFALMLAPIAVWVALRGETILADPIDAVPSVLLGLAVLFWVGGFDIIYACQDFEFDQEARLKSIPARFGVAPALRIAAFSHFLMVSVLLLLPVLCQWLGMPTGLGWLYYTGVAAIAGLLFYEHSLVRPDDLSRVNMAFFNVNAIVSFGLFVVGSLDVLW
ncbi:MAG: UbiA-like polyprenyltransferase [Pirellulaceae bacterium]